ncbi:MAG: PfkB family carbohydrate kinase [Clostridiales bacterium]|nr:PfkB family carbohydrate kinase [Clostridiales bacterium]
MILCVSLSPCLEINFEVDSLSVGKMHKVINRRTFFTGKAMNVATGLSRLGAHALASGFMYEDNGRLYEQEMHKEGVTYKFVWNRGRVKEVYKFIDRRSMLTEVVDDATPIDGENAKQLLEIVADLSKNCNAVVFSGDLSEGLPENYMHQVLSVIPQHVLKVVDTDGCRLSNLLDCGLDLVKPNMEELYRATGIKVTDRDSMIRACENLLERGAKRVLLSLGKHGAVICDGKQRLYCMSLNVAMNSTAGAGDAMVAAATKALSEGADLAEILRCGVAAGTASVTLPDSISFTKEKYDEVLQTLTVKEI